MAAPHALDDATVPSEEEKALLASPEAIKVYLDDKRECPEGWIQVKSAREFFVFLKNSDELLARVSHLSLDWHLGDMAVDGCEVARNLAYQIVSAYYHDETPLLPNLKAISFHSSDRDMAMRMHDSILGALIESKRDDQIKLRRKTPTL
jgi:hypothetical protein